MRKVWILLFFLLMVVFGFLSLLSFGSESLMEHTIAHSRQIDSTFQLAIHFVDDFKGRNGRLPNGAEFKGWQLQCRLQDPKPGYITVLGETQQLEYNNPCQEQLDEFGPTPAGQYALSLWRGEWSEYYVSPNHSSLTFDLNEYAFTKSQTLDAILFPTLAILSGLAALAGVIYKEEKPKT